MVTHQLMYELWCGMHRALNKDIVPSHFDRGSICRSDRLKHSTSPSPAGW